ncbi:MAG TPA: hydroxyisourate hydrolase [Streptosporangiaceae bacterium]|nr:hydroxyisourate hydrolase [Streptosporangiaceae bacterium]
MKISAQVLDSTYGQPAAGARARLERSDIDGWDLVAEAETDLEGNIQSWRQEDLERGLYRLVFDCDSYFAGLGGMTAYPEVVVIFRMPTELHACQVQVVLAPYSHSTYLGITEAGWSR